MGFTFRKAERSQQKLRAAIDGPSGAGKTYSAIRLGFALIDAGLGSRLALIDTENGSASLYAGEAPDGKPWEFDSLKLDQFNPDQYVAAIDAAEKAGYDVIVIDSLSHAWVGKGGALDIVDQKSGNKFAAWKDVTPIHRKMIDKIITSKAHVIATMRSKTEYVLEPNEKGQMVPRKIGVAPVQRDGMEYEFDVYGSVDWSHQIKISKSRCSAIQDATGMKPGPAFWQPLFDWLTSAKPAITTGTTSVPDEPGAKATPTPTSPPPPSLPSDSKESPDQAYLRHSAAVAATTNIEELRVAVAAVNADNELFDTQTRTRIGREIAAKKAAVTTTAPATTGGPAEAATKTDVAGAAA